MSRAYNKASLYATYVNLDISNGDEQTAFIKEVERRLEVGFNHAAVDIGECIAAANVDIDNVEDIRVNVPYILDPEIGYDSKVTTRMIDAINTVLKDATTMSRVSAITTVRECDSQEGVWTCHRQLLIGLRHVEIIDL